MKLRGTCPWAGNAVSRIGTATRIATVWTRTCCLPKEASIVFLDRGIVSQFSGNAMTISRARAATIFPRDARLGLGMEIGEGEQVLPRRKGGEDFEERTIVRDGGR